MRAVKSNDIEQYFKESRGLERDYMQELLTSRRRAWQVACCAGIVAFMALVAAICGVTQDAPSPLILRVDNATGAVDRITALKESEVSYGEVVDTYWLNQYVLNREGYDYNHLPQLYKTTALLSSAPVQKEYYALFEGPEARDHLLKNQTQIVVSVRSITPSPKQGIATIRFATREQFTDGRAGPLKHFIATVSYTYVNAPMSEEDRRINPLGFQVTSYRADHEVVTN